MKRIASVAVVTSLLISGTLAVAADARMRSAKAPYNFDLSKPGTSAWYGDDYGVFFGDTVTFQTARGQKAVMLSVMDDSAGSVSAAVWQEGKTAQVFCDSLGHYRISGGKPVYVQVIVDVTTTTGNGCATPELPTTGTVSVMFH